VSDISSRKSFPEKHTPDFIHAVSSTHPFGRQTKTDAVKYASLKESNAFMASIVPSLKLFKNARSTAASQTFSELYLYMQK
jgi:hypothetical protein